MYSFSYLEPVCCSMSSSNCCFLTCIQVSQEAGQVIWYSHFSQNFPQFIVIHTVKGFGIVNKAEIDVFLELSIFFHGPVDVGNLISGSSAFSKTSWNIWKFVVHVLLKPALENFEHYFTSVWVQLWGSLSILCIGILRLNNEQDWLGCTLKLHLNNGHDNIIAKYAAILIATVLGLQIALENLKPVFGEGCYSSNIEPSHP